MPYVNGVWVPINTEGPTIEEAVAEAQRVRHQETIRQAWANFAPRFGPPPAEEAPQPRTLTQIAAEEMAAALTAPQAAFMTTNVVTGVQAPIVIQDIDDWDEPEPDDEDEDDEDEDRGMPRYPTPIEVKTERTKTEQKSHELDIQISGFKNGMEHATYGGAIPDDTTLQSMWTGSTEDKQKFAEYFKEGYESNKPKEATPKKKTLKKKLRIGATARNYTEEQF